MLLFLAQLMVSIASRATFLADRRSIEPLVLVGNISTFNAHSIEVVFPASDANERVYTGISIFDITDI